MSYTGDTNYRVAQSYAESLPLGEIQNHADNVRQQLDDLSDAAMSALRLQILDLDERVRLLLDWATTSAALARAELLTRAAPSQVVTLIQQIGGHLATIEAQSATPNAAAYVNQLQDSLDALATSLAGWTSRAPDEELRTAISDAAGSYRRSLGQQISPLKAEVAELQGQAKQVENELAASKQTIAEHTATLDAQIGAKLAALDSSIEGITSQANANVQRLDRQIDGAQKSFTEMSESWRTQVAELEETWRNHMSEQVETSKEQNASLVGEGREKMSAMIADLQQQIDQARDLVSVFAGAGTGFAFGKDAKEQQTIADRWRYGAIALAVLAGVAAILIVFTFANTSSGRVYEGVGKAAVGLVFLGAAGYAARQSASHRAREEASRRAELRLVTLDPFIQALPADEQAKARTVAFDTLMTDPVRDADQPPSINSEQIGLIQTLISALLNLKK